ncbi:MAG: hypothetical protein L6Q92_06055 [Phycisphaerae bacterium]|nr:hypothetical protein [Phycisphaerae bacterium]
MTTDSSGAATQPVVPSELGESSGRLTARLRTIAALAIAAAVYWYVGYWVVEPKDPFAPISLLLVDNRLIVMAEMIALAIVAAGLAVAIHGGSAASFGPIAVAVGLAAVSLRGGSIAALPTALPTSVAGWPTRDLIVEMWLWCGLIAVGAVVGHWVASWFTPPAGGPRADWRKADGAMVDSAAELTRAAANVAIVAVVAFVLVRILGGDNRESILKGQVYFAVGIGFYLATLLCQWFLRLRQGLWLLLAVAIVGTVGYAVGAPNVDPASRRIGARIELAPICRALPMEFAAMGAIGVLAAHDSVQRAFGAREE